MQSPSFPCPVAKKCGGCQLQNMAYQDQLRYKQGKVIGLLGKFCRVQNIVSMEDPYHYRNKVQAAFSRDRRGIISGVYQSSSHRIVPIDCCLLEDKLADEVIVTVRKLLQSFKLEPWNDGAMRGFLRHVLVKRSFSTGQMMVVLVTGTPNFPCKHDFVAALLQKHPEITTVVQNINNRFTSLVLGERSINLYGDGYIEDELLGHRFRISPKAFYQINPAQTARLYSLAIDGLKLCGTEVVLDAYCGTGTIGIIASKGAKKVIGVELNADAVKDAKYNATLNNISNIEFVCGDAGQVMEDMSRAKMKLDAVIMDPPRAGSTVQFMRSLIKAAPSKVAYISCNPETLARDLGYLTKHGYKATKITPVDMFPHTSHIEVVVSLVSDKTT